MRRSFLLLVATIEGGCDSCKPDNPEEGPSQDVPLRLVQGDRAWNLGVADARSAGDNQFGWVTWTFRVPRGVEPGSARLVPDAAEPVEVRIR